MPILGNAPSCKPSENHSSASGPEIRFCLDSAVFCLKFILPVTWDNMCTLLVYYILDSLLFYWDHAISGISQQMVLNNMLYDEKYVKQYDFANQYDYEEKYYNG